MWFLISNEILLDKVGCSTSTSNLFVNTKLCLTFAIRVLTYTFLMSHACIHVAKTFSPFGFFTGDRFQPDNIISLVYSSYMIVSEKNPHLLD